LNSCLHLDDLSNIAAEIISMRRNKTVIAVAIAGPPGSGKSTFAEKLFSKIGTGACVIPMDGFHLDNIILQERGLMSVKGAPQTFNQKGFAQLVLELHSQSATTFPTFDRQGDCVIQDGGKVPPDTSVLLFEGNYLLYNAPGWRELADKWDVSIWLDVPYDKLRERLIKRWINHGLPKAVAIKRAENNDLVNAQLVIDNALPATWIVSS
jgi:pantothenate kinase